MRPGAAARASAAALALALAAASPAASGDDRVRSVEVEGTAFRVTLTDGRVLAQDELPGAVLTLGDGSGRQRRIRIDAVERDPRDPAGEVVLYGLSRQDPGTGAWPNLCEPDPDGRRLGFPLAGAFTPDGRHVTAPGRFLITCTGGAEGKCVRFGYKPWGRLPDGSPLEPYYQACTRLVRADYAGDGVGHTRDGTPIDIFDRVGIQRDEPAPGMTLEAAWGPDGAVCVRHARIRGETSPGELERLYPARLAGRTGEACTEEKAAGSPEVLLFNRSF